MDRISYLQLVSQRCREVMAASKEEAFAVKAYHGADSFQGLYYELAQMELSKETGEKPHIRDYIIEKALDRINTRLDCADFVIPALIRMLYEHRGTDRLPEDMAKKIDESLIGFKYWLDEPGECMLATSQKPIRCCSTAQSTWQVNYIPMPCFPITA